MLIILILILFPLVGWLLGKLVAELLFPKSKFPDVPKSNYTDKSVHHHYHDNRSVHVDGETFKQLTDQSK